MVLTESFRSSKFLRSKLVRKLMHHILMLDNQNSWFSFVNLKDSYTHLWEKNVLYKFLQSFVQYHDSYSSLFIVFYWKPNFKYNSSRLILYFDLQSQTKYLEQSKGTQYIWTRLSKNFRSTFVWFLTALAKD